MPPSNSPARRSTARDRGSPKSRCTTGPPPHTGMAPRARRPNPPWRSSQRHCPNPPYCSNQPHRPCPQQCSRSRQRRSRRCPDHPEYRPGQSTRSNCRLLRDQLVQRPQPPRRPLRSCRPHRQCTLNHPCIRQRPRWICRQRFPRAVRNPRRPRSCAGRATAPPRHTPGRARRAQPARARAGSTPLTQSSATRPSFNPRTHPNS